jgi:hypothetical protein
VISVLGEAKINGDAAVQRTATGVSFGRRTARAFLFPPQGNVSSHLEAMATPPVNGHVRGYPPSAACVLLN